MLFSPPSLEMYIQVLIWSDWTMDNKMVATRQNRHVQPETCLSGQCGAQAFGFLVINSNLIHTCLLFVSCYFFHSVKILWCFSLHLVLELGHSQYSEYSKMICGSRFGIAYLLPSSQNCKSCHWLSHVVWSDIKLFYVLRMYLWSLSVDIVFSHCLLETGNEWHWVRAMDVCLIHKN
jgi:hypothetical protein